MRQIILSSIFIIKFRFLFFNTEDTEATEGNRRASLSGVLGRCLKALHRAMRTEPLVFIHAQPLCRGFSLLVKTPFQWLRSQNSLCPSVASVSSVLKKVLRIIISDFEHRIYNRNLSAGCG